jgi:hypothetical protein
MAKRHWLAHVATVFGLVLTLMLLGTLLTMYCALFAVSTLTQSSGAHGLVHILLWLRLVMLMHQQLCRKPQLLLETHLVCSHMALFHIPRTLSLPDLLGLSFKCGVTGKL